jgi:hypothetical protein
MTTPSSEPDLERCRQAGRAAYAAGEVRSPALSPLVREATPDWPAADVADAIRRAYLDGSEAASGEAPPEFTGDYTGVAADDFGVGSLQLVLPGAYIGEDPELSTTPSLIFGDPGEMAVCIHGTPDQRRAWVARAAELLAHL